MRYGRNLPPPLLSFLSVTFSVPSLFRLAFANSHPPPPPKPPSPSVDTVLLVSSLFHYVADAAEGAGARSHCAVSGCYSSSMESSRVAVNYT